MWLQACLQRGMGPWPKWHLCFVKLYTNCTLVPVGMRAVAKQLQGSDAASE
jgi:hypothetical protein